MNPPTYNCPTCQGGKTQRQDGGTIEWHNADCPRYEITKAAQSVLLSTRYVPMREDDVPSWEECAKLFELGAKYAEDFHQKFGNNQAAVDSDAMNRAYRKILARIKDNHYAG